MEGLDSNLEFSRISQLLRKSELDPDEANELTERISTMASANIISRLESKIDSQNTKIDAQTTKYNVLIWVIGTSTILLSLVITLVGFLR